ADVELEDNAGLPEGACRGHFRDMGDLAEVTLERFCQARCHGIRARAGKLRLHQDRWKIDLRKRRDRQLQKRKPPGKRNPQGKERGRHRTRDERRGEGHTWDSAARMTAANKGAAAAKRKLKSHNGLNSFFTT